MIKSHKRTYAGRQNRGKSAEPTSNKPKIEVRQAVIELYEPHPGQCILHSSEARFRCACCGRRWGKTLAAVNEIAKFNWEHPKWMGQTTISWWVAPTYGQAEKAFRVLIENFDGAIKSKRQAVGQMTVVWKNGSVTRFVSAERYDNLRGEGVAFMVIDECAMIMRAAWEKVLRPMLSDTMGRALLISTPRGKNWFYAMYRRGDDPNEPDFESFSFPTASSPYVPQSEVDEAQRTLPEDVFAQEYLGAFLDEAAGVFHGIELCVYGSFESYNTSHRHVIGWDIAKHTDFSVVSTLDVDHVRIIGEGEARREIIVPHLVAFDRFNTIDYVTQVQRVAAAAKKYQTYVLLDSTGLGDPIYDLLCTYGIPCYPYSIQTRSKQQLIQNLAVLIQTASISYPEETTILQQELASYQYSISPTGNVQYSAPEGDHDDCVISLALAAWAAQHPLWNAETILSVDDDETISPI